MDVMKKGVSFKDATMIEDSAPHRINHWAADVARGPEDCPDLSQSSSALRSRSPSEVSLRSMQTSFSLSSDDLGDSGDYMDADDDELDDELATAQSPDTGGDPLAHRHSEFTQTSKVRNKRMVRNMVTSSVNKDSASYQASLVSLRCKELVENRYFEWTLIVLILLDMVIMAMLHDLSSDGVVILLLHAASVVLTVVFIVELGMRVPAQVTIGFDWVLLGEAIIVIASAADVFLQLLSTDKPGVIFLRPLRGFRIIRGIRMLVKIAHWQKGADLVLDVLVGAGKPLIFIQIIMGVAVLGAAIMVTVQVPPVIDELDQMAQNRSHVRELVLSQFGGVWKTSSTLLEAVLGSVDLGPTCIMIFQSAPIYSVPTGWFLSTLLMSILLLRLMTLGLVGGVFLSQLVYIKGETQLEVGGEAFRANQQVMFTMDEAFTKRGHDTSDHIEWDDVVDVMKELEGVGVAKEDAKAAFDELDMAGPVCLEDFISAVFKHHSTAKSVSKITQDHQQVKVHARVKLYGSFMHKTLKHLQERVWEVKSLLPEMIKQAKAVGEDLEKLDKSEEYLIQRRKDVWDLTHGGSKEGSGAALDPYVAQQASVEETLLHSELNDELKRVEAEIQSLLESPLPEVDSEHAIDALASELVESFMQSTSEEIQRSAKNVHVTHAKETHFAVVLIKPHVVNDKVKKMVREQLESKGVRITSEREISLADPTRPSELQLGAEMEAAFEKHFRILWREAVGQTKQQDSQAIGAGLSDKAQANQVDKTRVYNASDAASKLHISSATLSSKCNSLQGGDIFKFGDGFTCCKLNDIYVINAFYLSTNTHCLTVEWDARKLSWKKFHNEIVGCTSHAIALEGSILRIIRSKWKELDLNAMPISGDSCVAASASPLQALAERCYWLQASVSTDLFGKALLAEDIPHETIIKWFQNPTVDSVRSAGRSRPLFEELAHLDADECLQRCKILSAA
eukprot:TRINITY_DN23479_c0_g1_i1.p1 TRINITY_DN23479_c0_g1~~TRINITY_DN23479_c0_g1_i1.p1  ORF type:complete len:962 (+),score=166.83 TRINITY_DN23479_c0_g1_i1:115-3000(+)